MKRLLQQRNSISEEEERLKQALDVLTQKQRELHA
jgi:hypothetical protein